MPSMPRTVLLTALLLAGGAADASAASGVTVADPAGGARWTATQASAGDGRTCITGPARPGLSRHDLRATGLAPRVRLHPAHRASSPTRATRTMFVAAFAPASCARACDADGTRTYRRRRGRRASARGALRPRRAPGADRPRPQGRAHDRAGRWPAPAVQVADPSRAGLASRVETASAASASRGSACRRGSRRRPSLRGPAAVRRPDGDVPARRPSSWTGGSSSSAWRRVAAQPVLTRPRATSAALDPRPARSSPSCRRRPTPRACASVRTATGATERGRVVG